MSYGGGHDSDDESTVLDHRNAVGTEAFRAHYGSKGSPTKKQVQMQVTPSRVQQPTGFDYGQEAEDGYYGGTPSGHGGSRESALQEEVSRLRDALSATSTGTAEANYLQQLKKARDLNVKLESERAKVSKLQQQIVNMEREKMQQEAQEKKGILLPSQKSPSKHGGSTVAGDSDAEILAKDLSETKDRLDRSGRLVANLRKQNDDLKRDMQKLKKVLSHEIGDVEAVERAVATISSLQEGVDDNMSTTGGAGGNPASLLAGATTVTKASAVNSTGGGTTMSTANNKEPGWRGRAQQISLLKSKVKDLERFKENTLSQMGTPRGTGEGDDSITVRSGTTTQIRDGPLGGGGARSVAGSVRTTTTMAGRTDVDDQQRSVIERAENKKKQEARELKQSLDEKSKEIDKEKSRADSLTARLQILERDNQHLKVCMAKILEKTENDDKLITHYKDELDAKSAELREIQLGGGTAGDATYTTNSGATRGNAASVAYDAATQRELQSLKATVAQLHSQLEAERKTRSASHFNRQRLDDDSDDDTQGGGQPTLNGDSELAALLDLAAESPDAALSKAIEIIDLQRRTLLAVNEQLQEKEKVTTIYLQGLVGNEVAKHTREENIYLKERIKDLTKLMDQEVSLYKQLAEQGGAPPVEPMFQKRAVPESGNPTPRQVGGGAPPQAGRRKVSSANAAVGSQEMLSTNTSGGKPPVIAGRRKDSASSGKRPDSVESQSTSGAVGDTPPASRGSMMGGSSEISDSEALAMKQELQNVKAQYAELKKAYNSQAMSSNRVKTPSSQVS